MTDLKIRKKRRKKLLKSKAAGVVAAFVMFFVFAVLLCVIFLIMCMMTFDMQVENGFTGELEKAIYIEKLYAEISDEQNSFSLLDSGDMDYILFDKSNNIIRRKGQDTRTSKSGKYVYTTSDDDTDDSKLSDEELMKRYSYVIYEDKQSGVLKIGSFEMPFDLDYYEYAKLLLNGLNDFAGEEADDRDEDFINGFEKGYSYSQSATIDAEVVKASNETFIQMPVWVKIDVPKKNQTLYFKCVITTKASDLEYLISILLFVIIVLFLMFILLIVVLIRGALNIRRMRNLLFTDIKIEGRNWLWFMFNAERILSKGSSAKQGFALIDLEFIGYRRFCVCNSVDEGEVILKSVYDKLKGYIEKNELMAHNAEDSFALMIKASGEEGVKNRVELILSALGEMLDNNSLAFHAGIYIVPAIEGGGFFNRRKDVDVESIFNNACTACAALSESESSGLAFYNEKLVEEQRWIDTVHQLQQRALDNEEFVVYYQPKYDPRTHELRGAEALIRWQSPEYGFITPYRFIPIFEKNGFITEIDHYMLTHVARDQKRWLDEGQRCVPVSVNVSRAHFIEEDLAEQIRDIVDNEGAPHELVEIELTESAFFDDKKAMINTISKLKEYGFAVSMDDFGSGYSSLNSLKDMPLDVLKLDAEFFRGEAADSERGEVVVSEAIKLAKSLNMRTVAEGVEVKEQVEFLASQGCDMIQGYYFAKPMPANEYEERMKKGRSDGDEA